METVDIYALLAPLFFGGLFMLLFVMAFTALGNAARWFIEQLRNM